MAAFSIVLNNTTGGNLTYGVSPNTLTVNANSSATVPTGNYSTVLRDPNLISDIKLGNITASDGVTNYSLLDALNYIGKVTMPTNIATENRVDVPSAANIVSGNSGTILTGGYTSLSFIINITAASGTLPFIYIDLQVSDDNSTWFALQTTPAISIPSTIIFAPSFIPYAYYRFAWVIGGTTPSFTFSITSTVKAAGVVKDNRSLMRPSDLNLGTVGNVSSSFFAGGANPTTNLLIVRTTGTNTCTYTIDVSTDNFTWVGWSGPNTLAVSPTSAAWAFTTAFRYWRVRVITTPSSGGGLCNMYWSSA